MAQFTWRIGKVRWNCVRYLQKGNWPFDSAHFRRCLSAVTTSHSSLCQTRLFGLGTGLLFSFLEKNSSDKKKTKKKKKGLNSVTLPAVEQCASLEGTCLKEVIAQFVWRHEEQKSGSRTSRQTFPFFPPFRPLDSKARRSHFNQERLLPTDHFFAGEGGYIMLLCVCVCVCVCVWVKLRSS